VQKQVKEKTVVAATVFFDSVENLSTYFP